MQPDAVRGGLRWVHGQRGLLPRVVMRRGYRFYARDVRSVRRASAGRRGRGIQRLELERGIERLELELERRQRGVRHLRTDLHDLRRLLQRRAVQQRAV